MPDRTLTVIYTSDIHGCLCAKAGQPGLAALMNGPAPDGDTLLLDGGDTLQGSAFAYSLAASGRGMAGVTAALMNLAGYRYVTLGNHDFSFGKAELEKYLALLDAECLCANVSGVRGVEKLALTTLSNGLRIGLTGVITPFVPQWEKPENVQGVTFSDPVSAARDALRSLRAQGADVTVCLCHMGFENDPVTGQTLSQTGENRAYEIAAALGFSLVLAGHTHAPFAGGRIGSTFACAPADKAVNCIRAEVREDGTASAALIKTGTVPDSAAAALLAPYEKECEAFLVRPIGRLSAPIPEKTFLDSALHGNALANLFNAVQKAVTGADISVTSLQNTPPGLGTQVSAGDVIGAYPFPNTLTVIRVGRDVLKQALERSAAFLTPDGKGHAAVDRSALEPVPQFYNYDYFSGLYARIDLSRPVGARVLSLVYEGEELAEDRLLTLCLNSYRASGAGGYPFYRDCEVLSAGQDGVQELLLDHFRDRGTVMTDAARYCEFYIGKELL